MPSYWREFVSSIINLFIIPINIVIIILYFKDHLSQIKHDLRPNFVPSPSNVPCYVVKPNGKKVKTSLDQLASTCKQQPNFGNEEVTVFITGLPATTETVRKANRKLIEAYLQRYNTKRQQPQKYEYSGEKLSQTSSEEDSNEWQKQEPSTGNLVVSFNE